MSNYVLNKILQLEHATVLKTFDLRVDFPPLLAAPCLQPCCLAHIRAPALNAEFGIDSASYLASMVGDGRPLTATVVGRDKPTAAGPRDKHPHRNQARLHLVLREEGSSSSINEEMLMAGESFNYVCNDISDFRHDLV